MFQSLQYANLNIDIALGIPKVGSQIQADTLSSIMNRDAALKENLNRSISYTKLARAAPNFPQPCVYVGGTAYNWFPVWRDIPETTDMRGNPSLPARTIGFQCDHQDTANVMFALLGSSLGYWWWAVASDGFNLKKWLLERFPISVSLLSLEGKKALAKLGADLRQELKKHYVYKDNKGRIGNFYLPACAKQVEAIDTALAHYIPELSLDFFEDVRAFNADFSRSTL